MGRLIFILGGARSGKSSFALELAKKTGKIVTFIATAVPFDSEMKERINNHKGSRPKNWKTIETVNNLDEEIYREGNEVILIDCLTIYVSNLINLCKDEILNHIKKIIKAIKKSQSKFIVVSNEVGFGIVPNNKLSRKYRDILGWVNQIFALEADEFYVMFAGIPINMKEYEQNQRDNFKN